MLAEKIIGVWELQIWETVVDDNVIGYPLGEKASGFIAYHPIGFMSVNISAANRVRLATDDPFAGDPKLVALDAKGYLSYCGPFSVVSENEVIHHLEHCSFENWVGTDQHRHAQLDLTNDTLILSTAPVLTQGRRAATASPGSDKFGANQAVDESSFPADVRNRVTAAEKSACSESQK